METRLHVQPRCVLRSEAAVQLEALQARLGGIANDAFQLWATWAATYVHPHTKSRSQN